MSANSIVEPVKITSMIRAVTSRLRSDMRPPSAGFRMFSLKIAVGASRAPDDVDRMADSSAPKNSTCANSGVLFRISVGRISWKSLPSLWSMVDTMSFSIRKADTAMNIGTKAISR